MLKRNLAGLSIVVFICAATASQMMRDSVTVRWTQVPIRQLEDIRGGAQICWHDIRPRCDTQPTNCDEAYLAFCDPETTTGHYRCTIGSTDIVRVTNYRSVGGSAEPGSFSYQAKAPNWCTSSRSCVDTPCTWDGTVYRCPTASSGTKTNQVDQYGTKTPGCPLGPPSG
jgi:hypothetical protein